MSRVDERLIHGQVLASWAKKLQARQIVVVDDQLAGDSFAETVLTMALPREMELRILDVANGSAWIQGANDGTGPNTILLVKSPEVLAKLWELGYRPDQINIGGMAAGTSRRLLYRSIYASEDEIKLLRMFQEGGTEVFVQIVPAEPKIRLSDLL